ncbi:MAG: tetratricopeptide repeat protein [Treponema sp.]|nr:tetratricopeptide repeat protein [Treponema sp.]
MVPILIAAITGVSLVVVIILVVGSRMGKTGRAGGKAENSISKKGKLATIKDMEKKLAHNPRDVQALETLGEIYYTDANWDKVYSIYKTLFDIAAVHLEVKSDIAAQRMGIASFQLDKIDDAINMLMLSAKKNSELFETHYYLGRAFYKKDIFDKAFICFKKCKQIAPENNEVNQYLGMSLFKAGKYREALPFLKRVLDENPDNKEVLYDMAVAMSECAMGDKAIKLFMHLRLDPQFGAQSCLEAGKLHEKAKNIPAAIQDYEIAMKLENVPEPILVQILYKGSQCYIQQNNISKGLTLLKQIQGIHAGYKDVDALVARYSELNQNQNLQTYLLSGTSDFVALCRKFVAAYYKDSFVKVEDVAVASESVEIICNIEANKWEAKQLMRFYRTQNPIGDIYIRDFHSKMRDSKCDSGFVATMGVFSESAHKYTEGRPIDLIEKDELCKILKKINMFS